MDSKGNIGKYDTPDMFSHVYVFCTSMREAEMICAEANANKITCRGRFEAGSFKVVETIEGSSYCGVVGTRVN